MKHFAIFLDGFLTIATVLWGVHLALTSHWIVVVFIALPTLFFLAYLIGSNPHISLSKKHFGE